MLEDMLKLLSGKKKEDYRYKLTVFFVCLVISSLVWMLIKLANQYTVEVEIPLTFANYPKDKILVSKVDSIISIGISDQGFTLAWIKYFSRKTPLRIDLSDYRTKQQMHGYVANVGTRTWAQHFLEQYDLKGQVTHILPDTITFYFEDRYTREVPVEAKLNLNFSKQYYAYDTLVINPATVEISGLYQTVDTIEKLTTKTLSYDKLNQSINAMVAVEKPANSPGLRIEPDEVNLKLRVDKFTESTIEVPVSIKHQPPTMRIKIFPETVTIKYLVALDDFKKINPDMFSVSVDLSMLNQMTGNKLELSIDTHPAFVKIINTEPSTVDFLVLK
jgi:YbbR domain-containing protein